MKILCIVGCVEFVHCGLCGICTVGFVENDGCDVSAIAIPWL